MFQPLDEEGEVNYAPYIEDGFEDVCIKTWAALTSEAFNGRVLRFADEQRLVDQAHGDADRAFLSELGDNINSRIATICEMIQQPDYGKVSMLILEIDQRSAVYHRASRSKKRSEPDR